MACRILMTGLLALALGGCASAPTISRPVPIEFHSEPAGADVWVDGTFAGNTPLIQRFEWPSDRASRRVEFRMSGYIPESREITGEMAVLAVLMQEAVDLMVLRVESVPPGATVKIGPNAVGTTPLDVRVGSKGPQPPLSVTLAGYRSEAIAIESVKAGEPLRVHLQPLIPSLP